MRLNPWQAAGLAMLASGGVVLALVSWRPLYMYGGPQFEPASLNVAIGLAVIGAVFLAFGSFKRKR